MHILNDFAKQEITARILATCEDQCLDEEPNNQMQQELMNPINYSKSVILLEASKLEKCAIISFRRRYSMIKLVERLFQRRQREHIISKLVRILILGEIALPRHIRDASKF